MNQSALSATDWSAFFYIGEEPNTAATQAIAISYRKDELRYWFGANDVDVTTDFKANEGSISRSSTEAVEAPR